VPKHCFVVMTDPVAGREDEYNDWYAERHLPEVLALDGFASAQRFAFAPTGRWDTAPHRYLAIYEVDGDRLDVAAAALGEALDASERDVAAGRPPRMARSAALAPARGAWWFSAIGERRVAGAR
jgi:hypothetical protein